MGDPKAIEDWLRVHRQLLDQESAFTDFALRSVSGEVSLVELEKRREELMSLRQACTAAYNRAFSPESGGR